VNDGSNSTGPGLPGTELPENETIWELPLNDTYVFPQPNATDNPVIQVPDVLLPPNNVGTPPPDEAGTPPPAGPENGNGKGKGNGGGKGNRPPKGKAARDELSKDAAKAARIAAKSRMKKEDMERILEYDEDLAVDLDHEQLMYLCESAALDGSPAEETPIFAEAVDPPTSDAFLLHSRPNASRIIYLDFTGKQS
jgi:hypothetical protein